MDSWHLPIICVACVCMCVCARPSKCICSFVSFGQSIWNNPLMESIRQEQQAVMQCWGGFRDFLLGHAFGCQQERCLSIQDETWWLSKVPTSTTVVTTCSPRVGVIKDWRTKTGWEDDNRDTDTMMSIIAGHLESCTSLLAWMAGV